MHESAGKEHEHLYIRKILMVMNVPGKRRNERLTGPVGQRPGCLEANDQK